LFFSGDIAWTHAGADATVWLATGYALVDLRHGRQPARARLNRQRLRRMAGPFRVRKAVPSRAGAGRCSQLKGVGPRLCRALKNWGRAVLRQASSVRVVSGVKDYGTSGHLGFPPQLADALGDAGEAKPAQPLGIRE